MTYAATVMLDQDSMLVDDPREMLQPGKLVVADISTGQRRLIDDLLSPVVQIVTESGRESDGVRTEATGGGSKYSYDVRSILCSI
ncbi:hypothetical protein [Lichenihabitans psoromatis]|uniref:hypothetical protein n=1 Tax=Lichenihabitans psoromatis TaxID=2528642 RepID=UPI0010382D79|nr:hypothetical protein [Lichenihabitans psoromatis]